MALEHAAAVAFASTWLWSNAEPSCTRRVLASTILVFLPRLILHPLGTWGFPSSSWERHSLVLHDLLLSLSPVVLDIGRKCAYFHKQRSQQHLSSVNGSARGSYWPAKHDDRECESIDDSQVQKLTYSCAA